MNFNKMYKPIFILLIVTFLGCHGHFAMDVPEEGKYDNKPYTFSHGYDSVWSAILQCIEDMGWDIEKADKEKGEIHLRTSYVYNPEFGVLSRIYVEPLNEEARDSVIKPYLRSVAYYEKTTAMDPKFVRENLNINVTSVSDSQTNVKINYKVEPYYNYTIAYIGSTRSKGKLENTISLCIDEILNAPVVAEMPPPAPADYQLNLKDIFFDFDKYNIREDAMPILQENAAIIKNNPDYTILIESYADIRGTDKYNLRLAQNRADSTKQHLVQMGVMPQKIVAVGRGETEIFGAGKTEEVYQLNRRSYFRHTKPLFLGKYFSDTKKEEEEF